MRYSATGAATVNSPASLVSPCHLNPGPSTLTLAPRTRASFTSSTTPMILPRFCFRDRVFDRTFPSVQSRGKTAIHATRLISFLRFKTLALLLCRILSNEIAKLMLQQGDHGNARGFSAQRAPAQGDGFPTA